MSKEKLIKFIEKYNRGGAADDDPDSDASLADIVDFTIDTGEPIKHHFTLDMPLLSMLIVKSKFALAEYVINNGADVNAKDSYGYTPLYHASAEASEEFKLLLINKGAKTDKFLIQNEDDSEEFIQISGDEQELLKSIHSKNKFMEDNNTNSQQMISAAEMEKINFNSDQEEEVKDDGKGKFLTTNTNNDKIVKPVIEVKPSFDFPLGNNLLDYDKTSSEEEILRKSFNIPYKAKFIPGNKIHKELAYKEQRFKEDFYNHPKINFKKYDNDAKDVLEEQNKKNTEKLILKKQFKEDLYNNAKCGVKDISNLTEEFNKNRALVKEFKSSKSLTDHAEPRYPNFATANIGYVKDDKFYSKPMINNYKSSLIHSEAQIFDIYKTNYKSDIEKIKPQLIVLDVHTKMAMCQQDHNGGTNCTTLAD